MPIYEYKCGSCGNLTEVIQKMADPPLTTCDACSGPLEKLFSRTSFQLSGGGWYSTGYTKKGDSPPAKPAATSEPAPSSSTENGTKKSGGACGAGCGCH